MYPVDERDRERTVSHIRLIAIPPADTPDAELVDLCLAAERGGATSIQIRPKGRPAGILLRLTRHVMSQLRIPVYVNDRADVARVAAAAGAHVGAVDLRPATIRSVLPRPFRLGVSVGSEREATAALKADADYWSIGPFRATPTKQDAGSALGSDGFAKLAALCPSGIPVVAIGGIAEDNVAEAVRMGAQGVAAIGSIFGQSDVERATRALRAALDAA